MKIAAQECQKQNLDKPEVAYYQCSMVCSAIITAAQILGIQEPELISCMVKYPNKTSYSEEDGKYTGHYYLQYGEIIYDFTLRQFLPDSDFPFITDETDPILKKIYKKNNLSKVHYESVLNMARTSSSNEQLIENIVERFRQEP